MPQRISGLGPSALEMRYFIFDLNFSFENSLKLFFNEFSTYKVIYFPFIYNFG